MDGAFDVENAGRDLTTAIVHQWQCDHFGHLNVRHYAALFDDAVFILWNRHGRRAQDEIVPVTAELRLGFRSEVVAGTVVTIRSRIDRVGTKSVQVHFDMVDDRTNQVFATCDTVEVFFNRTSRKSEHIPEPVRESLTARATSAVYSKGNPARAQEPQTERGDA
jgi:acyl-CoA thioester hydrolase